MNIYKYTNHNIPHKNNNIIAYFYFFDFLFRYFSLFFNFVGLGT